MNTFHTLGQALNKSVAFNAGDIIQIEPGSSPGTVLNADLSNAHVHVANITIQGDPAAILANIPQFTIGNRWVPDATQTGWTFKNVNIELDDGGSAASPSIQLDGGGTVTGSTITIGRNENGDFIVHFNAGATANAINTFTNNTIVLGTATNEPCLWK